MIDVSRLLKSCATPPAVGLLERAQIGGTSGQQGFTVEPKQHRRVGVAVGEFSGVAIEYDDSFRGVFDQRPATRLRFHQPLFGLAFVALIAEDQHDADDRSTRGADRRGAVGDRHNLAVARHQFRMVGQAHDEALAQDFLHRAFHFLTRGFGTDVEDFVQRAAGCGAERPTGQLLGHRIHARDLAVFVGGDHRVADGIERDTQVFFTGLEQFVDADAFA